MAAGDTQVAVLLRHPNGTAEHATIDWLVGADGAHSTVREELGIAFDGDSVDVTFGIADAPVLGPVARDTLHYCYTADGALGVVPLPDEVFRIAVSIPHRDPADPPPADVFAQALRRHAPGFGELGEPRWTGSFRVRCRIAESFRRGRAFLAGDAAHVISPAGGQGMNLGIQDAVNLGWKLAGVTRATLSPGILGTYETERRAAAQRVAAATAAQTRWGMLRGRPRIAARDALVRVAAASGALQRVVGPLMAQTDVRYGTPAGEGSLPALRPPRLRVGMRLPVFAAQARDAGTVSASAGPTLVADRFTVLSWARRWPRGRPSCGSRGGGDGAGRAGGRDGRRSRRSAFGPPGAGPGRRTRHDSPRRARCLRRGEFCGGRGGDEGVPGDPAEPRGVGGPLWVLKPLP